MSIYVLAKSGVVEGDEACVTVHGFTANDEVAMAWESGGEHNVTFTADPEKGSTFEPMAPSDRPETE